MLRLFYLLPFALVIPVCVGGCTGEADGGKKFTVYPVSGKITLAGNPIAGAFVTYSPVDPSTARVATATTNDDGVYTLTTYEAKDGAAAGEYVVLVTKTSSSSGPSAEEAHSQYVAGGPSAAGHGSNKEGNANLTLPEKYSNIASSDLKATVKDSGENKYDFDLKP